MTNKEVIELLQKETCVDCAYMSESPFRCTCTNCEYKEAIKAAVKSLKGIDKAKAHLKAIEQDRSYRAHDSNFWEGFYMAEEVILEHLGGSK